MKTKTFNEIIEHLIEKGADTIKITRADSICGCINKNDIICVEIHIQDRMYIVSVQQVFSNPIINVDRMFRNAEGRCIHREPVTQYNYAV